MAIVIDLIVVAIIAIIALVSAKQGFIRVFVQAVGYILAGILAFAISTPLADTTYDKFVEKPVTDAIVGVFEDFIEENSDMIEEQIGENVDNQVNTDGETPQIEGVDQELIDKLLGSLPDILPKEEIESVSTSVTDFTDNITTYMSEGAESMAEAASKDIIKPLASKVIALIYSIIILSILSAIVNILANILGSKIVIGKLDKYNHILGGALGIVKGAFIVGIVCAVVSLVVRLTGVSIAFLSPENIEKSFVFEFLSDLMLKFYK